MHYAAFHCTALYYYTTLQCSVTALIQCANVLCLHESNIFQCCPWVMIMIMIMIIALHGTFQFDGNTLDNFAELKTVEGLKDGSLVKVVEEPYTMQYRGGRAGPWPPWRCSPGRSPPGPPGQPPPPAASPAP